ncbi:putative Avr9/Cf-9 rapidly elicited protein [Quillaja saponaria]|uniref:Avr9/Cf-9 rapidly elicited protein n=1 Tax=Quillaja saponaria TaxID=32244 RepID=A0AAD7PSQ5_QUISA|nr:putative Avr9/Cf-9 rapidly elicited protein [Quillaja saponaria]
METTLISSSLFIFMSINVTNLATYTMKQFAAHLGRSSKKAAGKSKPDGRNCKKHPKHRQSPGVCSLCLRERLAKLSSPSACDSRRTSTITAASSSSSSSLSSYYSSTSSSYASPTQRYRLEGNRISNKSMLFLFMNGKHALTKSRSLTFDNKSNKKGGFWFKLLRISYKEENGGDSSIAAF